jgi:hypothetical protein
LTAHPVWFRELAIDADAPMDVDTPVDYEGF